MNDFSLLIHLEDNNYLVTKSFNYGAELKCYEIYETCGLSNSNQWVDNIKKTSGVLWIYDDTVERLTVYDRLESVEQYFNAATGREVCCIINSIEKNMPLESFSIDFLNKPLKQRGAEIVKRKYTMQHPTNWLDNTQSAESTDRALVWQNEQLHILLQDKFLMPFVVYVCLYEEPFNLREMKEMVFSNEDKNSLYLLDKYLSNNYQLPNELKEYIKEIKEKNYLQEKVVQTEIKSKSLKI